MNLTEEQHKFATTKQKHLLVLAAAGAGKTGSVVHFIADKIASGSKPKNIISFSFTKKAANELKERVKNHFKKEQYDFQYIATIHSFCWNELIKPFHTELGYTDIPTIVHEYPDEFVEKEHKEHGKKKERMAYMKRFTNLVSVDLQEETFGEQETYRLISYLLEHNLIIFDLMVPLANLVILERREMVKKAMGKIDYIITDEAQDLNRSQYKFTKILQELFTDDTHTTYLVKVGDFKQSIYGFRGSDPKIINTYIEEFNPNVEILSKNFRSAPEIVQFANEFAEEISMNSEDLDRSKISIATQNHLDGDVHEIEGVEDFLEEIRLFEKPLDQICILARTNTLIKSVAKVLAKLEIPYYLHTEFDILKRQEVKILMSMLSMTTKGYNRALAVDLIKNVKGGVPIKIAGNIGRCESMQMVGRMFGDIKKIPELVEVYSLLEHADFDKAFPKLARLLETTKKPAISIQQSLERFHKDLKEVKLRENLSTWIEALEELLFEAQFLEEKTQGKVQLMTVHKSKGLQWKSVIFLYDFSLLDDDSKTAFYDPEEEQRVVYTALTRPEQNLSFWNLSREDNSHYFTKGGLIAAIERGIKYGELDIADYSRYS